MQQDECMCTVNEIEFFDPIPKQVVLEHGSWEDVCPANALTSNTPIEFEINGLPDAYIDLNNCYVLLRVKVVNNAASADLAATDVIGPANNWLQTMFSDITITLGNIVVEGGSGNYPYKAYLSNLLNFSKEVKNTHLETSGWYGDTASEMNSHTAVNVGFTARKTLIAESRTVELCGPLLLDMLLQQRYLLQNTNMRIKLHKTTPEFQMNMYTANTVNGRALAVKLIYERAEFYVRRVKALPSVFLDAEEKLNFQNSNYGIHRTKMTTYTIPSNALSNTHQSLFKGRMPKLLFIAMVRNDAYNGNYGQNPFYFQHFNVNSIGLYNGGISIPSKPFTPDFTNSLYSREYWSLNQALGIAGKPDSNGIQLNDFGNGYTIFGFNLTPDLDVASHAQVYREGDLKLELKFSVQTPRTINVIVMGIFDGQVDVTKQRKVLCDWK